MTTLATWPRPYRWIQFASIFEAQLSNGGIEQYFWNSSGALAPATLEAFDAMALPGQASVIGKGIALFGPPPYPIGTEVRRRVLRDGSRGADIDGKPGALTLQADLDGIETAMVAYARREGILPH